MLIDRGDKCRRVKTSNPKIEDVVLGCDFELPIISLTISLALPLSDHISLHVYVNATKLLWMSYINNRIAVTTEVIKNRSLQSTLRILGYSTSVSLVPLPNLHT